jgi:hypothetical protein
VSSGTSSLASFALLWKPSESPLFATSLTRQTPNRNLRNQRNLPIFIVLNLRLAFHVSSSPDGLPLRRRRFGLRCYLRLGSG